MTIWLIRLKMQLRPMDSYFKQCMSPPLALYIIKQVTPEQHSVHIVDLNLKTKLPTQKPDLVGITTTVDTTPDACRLSRYFRAQGVYTVVGGIHAMANPDDFINDFDSVCTGNAELVWAQILNDASQGALKKVYPNPRPLRGSDIPVIEAPPEGRYYLFDNAVTATRGCPFACDFCYNSSIKRPLVTRNIDDVAKEIDQLGTKHVLFVDDNFIADIAYARSLTERLGEMGITWGCAVSFNILHHLDLMDRMAACGCKTLFVGIETLNAKSLASMNKKQNNMQKYEKLVAEIHARGMMINASIMLGMDEDTVDSIRASTQQLIDWRVDTLTTHILTPYPGTKFYNRMQDQGRITNHDLSKYNTANVVFKPKRISKEALYREYLRVYQIFYSWRNIFNRAPKDNKVRRISYLLFNIVYRKLGKPISSIAYRLGLLHFIGQSARYLSYKIK